MISRREMMVGAAAGLVGLSGCSRAPTLRILTWEGYAPDVLVKSFEKAHGVRCRVVYAGSTDEMFARMRGSGGSDFDVIALTSSHYQRYVSNGLLQPFDSSRVPNMRLLLPEYRDVAGLSSGGKQWGVPYAWGALPLIYAKPKFPAGAPDSWGVLWDKQRAGQVLMMDDADNCVTLAAIYLGIKDPFALTDQDFARVKEALIRQRPNNITYYGGFDEGVSLFQQNDAHAMFSMGEPQFKSLQARKVDVGLTIPKEGAPGFIDSWAITAATRDPALAHAWLNATLEPEVGRFLSANVGYGNVVDRAANENRGMNYGDRLVYLRPSEDIERRVALWNEVKSA